MDPDVIAEEYAGFAAAGIQHVLCAPWRTDAEEWLVAMERLAGLVIR